MGEDVVVAVSVGNDSGAVSVLVSIMLTSCILLSCTSIFFTGVTICNRTARCPRNGDINASCDGGWGIRRAGDVDGSVGGGRCIVERREGDWGVVDVAVGVDVDAGVCAYAGVDGAGELD